MKKLSCLFLILMFCIVVMIGLCACENEEANDEEKCTHSFVDATCTVKKTCSVCGETEGEALGHFYKDGICVDCGEADELGEYLTFVLNDDETAYEITECDSSISGKLIIPEMYNRKPVTSIGDEAFYRCDELTSIEIPNSVTIIGERAFSQCEALTSVEISNGVTTIGDYAFFRCTALTSIEIPASVTTIGYSAFFYCEALTSVEIPASVTTIGDGAFSYCTALTSVEIPASVTTIGDSAFSYCTALTSVEIPNSVTTIGDYAFSDCEALTSIEIPASVTTIGDHAFSRCTALTSVEIPASVTTIGDYAFEFCWRLVTIEIPNSVTSIGENAFSVSTSSKCNEYKNGLYLGNDENPYLVFAGMDDTSATSLVVHSNTKFILQNTFPFFKNLTEIQVEEGNGYYKSIDGNLYSGDGKTLIRYAIAKADTTFQIPKGVTTVGKMAFSECANLTGVVIPNSVTAIGEGAFARCTNLTSVVIPSSVTTIGTQVFSKCDGLTIYCEIAEEDVPNGWDGHWNLSACPVVWDYKAE